MNAPARSAPAGSAGSPTGNAPAGLMLPAGAPAAARAVYRLLQKLPCGTLDLQWPDGSHCRVGHGAAPHASISVKDWSLFSAVLKSGDIGFAETWIAGGWHTPDLPGLLRFLLANREAVNQLIFGNWWGSLLYRLRHLRNRNSREGSKRNIHAHYDLGNAFYRLWLDETMNYSSAWFDGDHTRPLPEAQHAKVRRALQQARVQPGDRVLEIGCGWGALAEKGTRVFGAHVTGVTLSTEQLAWANGRMAANGTAHQADLRLQDYRDIQDTPFDAVVSIEMFEAVGRSYWPSYFETVARCLKPGGRACIQSITIRDDLFDRYVRSTDFIQQYIFPGGLLPSDAEFRKAAERAGLVVEEAMAFGPDYAETLRRWRTDFHAQAEPVRRLGFDEPFLRTWDFYLAYCEAAFDTGNTNVVQYTLRRP
jgi:cyclopropane-fatty-acyl-phospholipid synthase